MFPENRFYYKSKFLIFHLLFLYLTFRFLSVQVFLLICDFYRFYLFLVIQVFSLNLLSLFFSVCHLFSSSVFFLTQSWHAPLTCLLSVKNSGFSNSSSAELCLFTFLPFQLFIIGFHTTSLDMFLIEFAS